MAARRLTSTCLSGSGIPRGKFARAASSELKRTESRELKRRPERQRASPSSLFAALVHPDLLCPVARLLLKRARRRQFRPVGSSNKPHRRLGVSKGSRRFIAPASAQPLEFGMRALCNGSQRVEVGRPFEAQELIPPFGASFCPKVHPFCHPSNPPDRVGANPIPDGSARGDPSSS